MNYQHIYNQDYFNGKNSFFYKLGYQRVPQFYFDTLYNRIKRYVLTRQGTVLDVGCAYGYLLERFPEPFQKYGLDVSEHAIEVAQKRVPKGTFVLGNLEVKLPLKPDFFTVITANDVLEHVQKPQKALENLFKLLKEDGILYITTPNKNKARELLYTKFDSMEHHISLLSHQELKDLLEAVGFTIIDHWTYVNPLTFFRFNSNIGLESAFICSK